MNHSICFKMMNGCDVVICCVAGSGWSVTPPSFCRSVSEVQRALSVWPGAAVRSLHVPHLGGVWDFHTYHGSQRHRNTTRGGAGLPCHPGNHLPLFLFCEYSHIMKNKPGLFFWVASFLKSFLTGFFFVFMTNIFFCNFIKLLCRLFLCSSNICLRLFQLHFIYLVRSTKWILAGLGSVFVVMFLLMSCGLLFPYSGDPDSPRPKRVFLQVHRHNTTHTSKNMYTVTQVFIVILTKEML